MKTESVYARPELLQVADTVARDKSIDKEEVFQAMEMAIQKAGQSRYGMEYDIRATIDRTTGEISLCRYVEVLADDAEIENESAKIHLSDARRQDESLNEGDFITDPLPPIDFGRIAAQTAKQVIVQQVREAERARQYEEFKERKGEIITGFVKRIEYGNVIIDLGRGEAYLRRDESIPREHFNPGDRVRALVLDVRRENRGPQIFLSRTHPTFMARLFAQEVPEIYDGVIEIKAAARDPGSRAKMAVISHDTSIDPVGPCIGMRGVRVQAVVGELQGEKIDIIPWSTDPATFIVNALAPAEVIKVVVDEEKRAVEVVVDTEQQSLAIGRRGQNVRLASQLSKWDIDILTEEEESERRQIEFQQRSRTFIDALDVDDMIAQLLVMEGFSRVEEVAYVPIEELTAIDGFDEDLVEELRARATSYLEQREAELIKRAQELSMHEALLNVEGLSLGAVVALGEKGVKTTDDLADLASDELIEMLEGTEEEGTVTRATADTLIMSLRKHWFADDAPTEDAPTEDAPTEDAPTEDAPTEDAPTEDAPTEDAPAEDTPAEDTNTPDAPASL